MTRITLQKVGADVEGFLVNSKMQPIPCIGLINGTKEKPTPVFLNDDYGFAIQEDNVMPEYNIPAANTPEIFARNIALMRGWLANHFAGKYRLEYVSNASMFFIDKQLTHPQALKFGCEPDYCAWTQSVNEMPIGVDPLLRTSGGHLHVSYLLDGEAKLENHPEYLPIMEKLVQVMDLNLGIPSLFMDRDKIRRKLYGKAGAFRPKPYGHEYRVLSPFWTVTQDHSKWAFEQIKTTIKQVNDGFNISPVVGRAIQKAINTSNLKIAENLIRNFKINIV